MPGLHMLSERGGRGCIESEAPKIFIFTYSLYSECVFGLFF